LLLIRQRIANLCEEESPFQGEIEVDESYFGAKRVKGKRGRSAERKTPVFGILQRKGSVYTEIVPDCARKTLQALIRGKVEPDSVIHSDSWTSYIQIVGEAITVWLTWDIKSIIVFTMETTNLPEGKAILTGLNHSGHLQNEGLLNSMVSHNQPLTCTSRNVSFGSTTVTPISINCC